MGRKEDKITRIQELLKEETISLPETLLLGGKGRAMQEIFNTVGFKVR